jgi:H+/Cl- antiporter ClcA
MGLLLKHDQDKRVIEAVGAGAGLVVAFSAPIGGSVFVFEGLTSSFTAWLLVPSCRHDFCFVDHATDSRQSF